MRTGDMPFLKGEIDKMNQNPPVTKPGRIRGNQFLIDIRYHQHCSWQGSVKRLDTGETINFRSTLELINLIESVASQQAESGNETQRFRNWKNPKEVDQSPDHKGATGS